MKMSDVFELPVEVNTLELYCKEGIATLADEEEAAAHAINCHDGLVSLISELINTDSISIYESAIESGGPEYFDLREWADRARKLIDAPR